MEIEPAAPGRDCPLCPRLVAFREALRAEHPDWHNAPVPSFGSREAPLLIIGLAPGRRGANRTGRPFTGDFAGDLLYPTLAEVGLLRGAYGRVAGDGAELAGARVTNAVRCVPPENRPSGAEIAACRTFLRAEIASMPRLRALLALGRIAHESVAAAFGLRARDWPFRHGALYRLPQGLLLADSYHCSRQNTNTGRLTPEMFRDVLSGLVRQLASEPAR